jgi:hypothetical protein
MAPHKVTLHMVLPATDSMFNRAEEALLRCIIQENQTCNCNRTLLIPGPAPAMAKQHIHMSN